jgi:hypothetical protein
MPLIECALQRADDWHPDGCLQGLRLLRALIRRRLFVAATSICRRRFATCSALYLFCSLTQRRSKQVAVPPSDPEESPVGQSPGGGERVGTEASRLFLVLPHLGRKKGVLPGERRVKTRLDRSRMVLYSVGYRQLSGSSLLPGGRPRGSKGWSCALPVELVSILEKTRKSVVSLFPNRRTSKNVLISCKLAVPRAR